MESSIFNKQETIQVYHFKPKVMYFRLYNSPGMSELKIIDLNYFQFLSY